MGESAVTFSILIRETEEGYVAHCLELDLVSTGDSLESVESDMFDLIVAQVRYAFANDNLDFLYHSAPQEVWREFYACPEQVTERREISKSEEGERLDRFVPPWIIANTCRSTGHSHV